MEAFRYVLEGLRRVLWWGPLFPLAAIVHGLRIAGGDPEVTFVSEDVLIVYVGTLVWVACFAGILAAAGVLP